MSSSKKRSQSMSAANTGSSAVSSGKSSKKFKNNINNSNKSGAKSTTSQPLAKEKRYRFKNFNERIEDIDIGSIQSIGGYRGPGPQNTDSTWFELSLNEWKELNCSAAFAKFCYAVTPLTGTLPKLLFNQSQIVQEIFAVLKRANAEGPESPVRLALIPVLSLTAMLAKDLGSEFLPAFPEFYGLLLPILPSASDPETIEAAFASLLYVFKCLLEDLLKDLSGTFDLVAAPMLALTGSQSKSQHLRRFGAQCFGYLLRKSLRIGDGGFFAFVEAKYEACGVNQRDILNNFVADAFFFAIIDESTGRFRTCLKPLCLEIINWIRKTDSAVWCDILRGLTVKLLNSTDLETNSPLWKIFIQALTEAADDTSSSFIKSVLIDAFAYRRGTRVQGHSLLLEVLLKACDKGDVELLAHFLRSMSLEVSLQNRQSVIKLVSKVLSDDLSNLLLLSRWLVKIGWLHYDLVMADLVKDRFLSRLNAVEFEAFGLEIVETLLEKYSNVAIPSNFFDLISESVLSNVSSNLSLRALKLLIQHYPSRFPAQLNEHFMSVFLRYFSQSQLPARDELAVCTQVVSRMPRGSLNFDVFNADLLMGFCRNLKYPEQLKAVRVAIEQFSIIENDSVYSGLIDLIIPILRSDSEEWRLEALNLLSVLSVNSNNSSLNELNSVLQAIEGVPADLENYRDKLLQLKKLDHVKSVEGRGFLMVLNYLLGFQQIRLTLLWPEGTRILAKFSAANSVEFNQILSQIFRNPLEAESADVEMEKPAVKRDDFFVYEFEVDDEGLNRLKRLREEVTKTNDKASNSSPSVVSVENVSGLVGVVFKLFASNPEACPDEFRDRILLPAMIKIFGESGRNGIEIENDLNLPAGWFQSNLNYILKALSGMNFESVDELEGVLLRFLSHGDLQLQNRALEALLNTKKYGGALSAQWKGRLKALVDDNLFREELTSLTAEASSLPKVTHWHSLLAPLIVRILFGRFIARRGASAGRHSLPLRRKMIMACFGAWDQASQALIVDFLITSNHTGSSQDAPRQKLGFLNVLGDVFASLGRKIDDESMDRLIQELINIGCETGETQDDNVEAEEAEVDDSNDNNESVSIEEEDFTSNVDFPVVFGTEQKRIRQLMMKRLLQVIKLFESNALKRLHHFLPAIFNRILNPRIQNLTLQFTQSNTSSALLEILVCFAENLDENDLRAVCVEWSPILLTKTVEAFANESTKPIVISQLLSVFTGIVLKNSTKKANKIVLEEGNPSVLLKDVVMPGLSGLLDAFDSKLQSSRSEDQQNVFKMVSIAQVLAPHVTSSSQASRLCRTFEGLLRLKSVNEATRGHLISAIADLLKKSSEAENRISRSLFDISSMQWNVLRSRPAREALLKLFKCFSELSASPEIEALTVILVDLNAFVPGRLNEPDFDVRLAAFARLKRAVDAGTFRDTRNDLLNPTIPITWAMIYHLQDVEELSIRNQSFAVLKSIILSCKADKVMLDKSENVDILDIENSEDEFENENEKLNSNNAVEAPLLIQRIILPSIKTHIKSRIQVIRVEFVALLDLLIQSFPTCTPFSSLYALIKRSTDSGDTDEDTIEEDENIFRNIYHIQEPRRTRAIRQLGELAVSGRLVGLTRAVIEDLLLPLVLPTTLPDPNGEIAFEASEAMQMDSMATCGALIAQLPWRTFLRKLVHYVKELSESKRDEQWNRSVLRLLPAMISQFKFSVEEERQDFAAKIDEDVLPVMFRLLHKSQSTNPNDASGKAAKKLPKTGGTNAKNTAESIGVKHSLRVPIAIAIGQLIKLVSGGSIDARVVSIHLPRLLTDLLNVLKLKDPDARDVARGALVKIMVTFGPAYLPFLLREGRSLLNRGFQRHVLTFTTHAILSEFLRRSNEGSVDLDASADLLVDLALASSFGFQASERAAQEWTGKQLEVKAAKGPEIIALTTQFTSQSVLERAVLTKVTKLAELVILDSRVNTKGTGALDEKSEGLNRIEGDAFDSLLKALFSNGLYPLVARDSLRIMPLLKYMHYVLSLPCDSGNKSHMYRLHGRAFEFIAHILNSGEVDELNSALVTFVPLCRDYIVERGKHVAAITPAIILFNQLLSVKALHASIAASDHLQGLLQRLFGIILKGNSGTSEGSAHLAAAFRLTATLIRDWPDLEVTDVQIKALLEYTRLQLENQNHQTLTFSLIRSLISRQVVLLQLFELMESIRTVMLTSHYPSTRQQCRAAYVHFLLNYPMATRKLEEQLDFLLANVRYEHATGRESCIEAMAALIGPSKLPLEVVENIAEAWFVGLSVQLSKEASSSDYSEVVRSILRTVEILFNRLPLQNKRRANLELLLSRWILQSPKMAVQGAAWRIFASISQHVSTPVKNDIIFKVPEMIASNPHNIPDDLLRIVLDAVIKCVAFDGKSFPSENLNELLETSMDPKFFKESCELPTRHSIALLWNALLKQY